MFRQIFKFAGFTAALALLIAQFFRPKMENPVSDPGASFDAIVSPPVEVRSALARACNDCHSNHTVWPWYSNIAPVSWLVGSDVRQGRVHLNLSEWIQYGPGMSRSRLEGMCKKAATGNMPPWYFSAFHPKAKLRLAGVSSLCGLLGTANAGEQSRR